MPGRWRTAVAGAAIAMLGLSAAIAPTVLGGVVAHLPEAPTPAAAGQVATVRKVVDGDTIDVRVGGANRRVRLLQVDTPEVFFGAECYGAQASAATKRLLPVGTAVSLYEDPALDRTDAYGRLLRYVFRGTTNVNVSLVASGYAAPYFYRGERGRYAAGLERVARAAIAARRGLWGACPQARYDPDRALDTGPAPTGAAPGEDAALARSDGAAAARPVPRAAHGGRSRASAAA